jgi:hypothetical protein
MDRLAIGLLVCSVALGGLLSVELNSRPEEPTEPLKATRQAASVPPVPQRPQVDQLLQVALAQPLFSATRHPPDVETGSHARDPELPNMRLTAIVIEPDRRLAIFAIPGAKPLALAEGELINEWRVEGVAPNQVSLIGATGITILEPKFDPALVRPKPVTPASAKPPQAALVGARPTAPRPGTQPAVGAVFPPARGSPSPGNAALKANSANPR